MSKWLDPQRQLFLAKQSAAGLSAGDIAKQLGESKSAVACAMWRYGLFATTRPAPPKRRLADEYDAAQERGEVAGKGKPVNVPDGNIKATLPDLGLSRKDIHEARIIRDAESRRPTKRVGRVTLIRMSWE